jgi:hypothetical protein
MKLLNLKHPAALIGLITLLGLITLITLLTRAPPEPTPARDALCPRTGWSGDGAPETEDLKAFARGAVTQHFTKTTNRQKGVDFRLPGG